MERWKDIKDYEELYQVSSLGNIKNKKNNKILKPYKNGKYFRITLRKNNKNKKFYIHRLMATSFLNLNVDSKYQVDHIDNNSFNNNLNNLQLLSQKENIKKQMKNMKNHIKNYKNNKIKYMIMGCLNNER